MARLCHNGGEDTHKGRNVESLVKIWTTTLAGVTNGLDMSNGSACGASGCEMVEPPSHIGRCARKAAAALGWLPCSMTWSEACKSMAGAGALDRAVLAVRLATSGEVARRSSGGTRLAVTQRLIYVYI